MIREGVKVVNEKAPNEVRAYYRQIEKSSCAYGLGYYFEKSFKLF